MTNQYTRSPSGSDFTQGNKAAPATPESLQLILTCTRILTKKGKQTKAQHIMKKTLEQLQSAMTDMPTYRGTPPVTLFAHAVAEMKPFFEMKSFRRSGKVHQIPAFLSQERQEKIALRWLLQAARQRQGTAKTPLHVALTTEILQALKNQGPVIQKRQEIHRLAEVNRGFLHYRWWSP
jgi:small subunit ribosomal protein S7